MPDDRAYYPKDGPYWAHPLTIYAQYIGDCPNPCRKYHVSSDVESAAQIAQAVLPYLAERKVFHKVVKSRSLFVRQMSGSQAGKFITIYMQSNVGHLNSVVEDLGAQLLALQLTAGVRPCPRVPRSRSYRHVFIEQPLDEGMFIYGGFICDPSE